MTRDEETLWKDDWRKMVLAEKHMPFVDMSVGFYHYCKSFLHRRPLYLSNFQSVCHRA